MQENKLPHPFTSFPDAESIECLIYTSQSSPRLHYTCQFIFHTVFSVRFSITNSKHQYENYQGCKINYSNDSLSGGLQIKPQGFLNEKGIGGNKPESKEIRGLQRMFVNKESFGAYLLEYDVFSMVFYCISRYEEWQEFKKDEHQRFGAESSWMFLHKAHMRPLVDLCLQEMKEKLIEVFPDLKWPKKEAQIISTVDVDNLFAFKGRAIWKICAASLRDLLKADWKNLLERIQVLTGKRPDPFDIYDEVPDFCEKSSIPLIFFFLYRSGTPYDRGVKPGSKSFQEVFHRIKKHRVLLGLHPSYYSSSENWLLEKEKKQLQKDLGQNVNLSRQHFLRMDLRNTPKALLKAGMKVDFSMGFSDTPGFRAGTSFPFYYYDFEREEQTNLLFVPFCIMDGAYSIHHQKQRQEVVNEMLILAEDVKKCGGNFVSVFHERSFYDHLYPGFGTLYKELHLQIKALFAS